jgi:predicted nuclease of predicted toxin-antitoxin system
MKILVDMNLSPRWVGVLETAGFEAAHWSVVGAHDASDMAILSYARTNDCVILTHDLDFGAILATTRGAKPSVVQIRAEDIRPGAASMQVVAALRQMSADLEAGALVSVDVNRARLRVLPLRPQK